MLWTTDSVATAAWSLAPDWGELAETPCNETNMSLCLTRPGCIWSVTVSVFPRHHDDDHLTCLSSLTAWPELTSVSTPSPASLLCLEYVSGWWDHSIFVTISPPVLSLSGSEFSAVPGFALAWQQLGRCLLLQLLLNTLQQKYSQQRKM